MTVNDSISVYKYSLIWPRDWEGFLLRMQAVNELDGRISTHASGDNNLIVLCEFNQDYEILQACVALGVPPAF
jgi:hypothetical protein